MMPPGWTDDLAPADLPPGAAGATVRDVAWLDDAGGDTDDPARVASVIVTYRTDDGTPVLTVYGQPT